MILYVEGLYIPDCCKVHTVSERPGQVQYLTGKRRDNVALGQVVGWPAEVVEHIVARFKAIGLEDPLRQKLVDPYARYWGGRESEGVPDLEDTNWEAVKDYFTWETMAWSRRTEADTKAIHRFADKMVEKHGGMFSHQAAYGPERW